jgi:serine/threonine protein kinase
VLGTPEYMSPEQCQACELDSTTDIYALGITLYELVTGQKPFVNRSPLRLFAMQIEQPPRPPSELAPISPALEKVILKALGKHPSDRHETVGAFLEDLKAAVPEVLPWTTSLDADRGDVSGSKTMPPFPRCSKRRPK